MCVCQLNRILKVPFDLRLAVVVSWLELGQNVSRKFVISPLKQIIMATFYLSVSTAKIHQSSCFVTSDNY